MSRAVRVTIKYFAVCGLTWLFALTIRPILHHYEELHGDFPFWVWEIEPPICALIIIGIIIFWGYQTYQRVLQKAQRRMFCAICYCSACWMAFSCAEQIFFSANDSVILTAARLFHYACYLAWTMIPLLILLIALYIGKSDLEKIDRRYLLLWIPYGLINLGILTNDLHRQAFSFPQGMDNYRISFTHGWLFYLAYAWIFVVSVAAMAVLLKRARVPSVRKFCILPLMSLAMGQVLTYLAWKGSFYLRTADVCIFAFGVTLEICMRCNLIPSNVHYPDLIKSPEFQVYIFDDDLKLASMPENAEPIPAKPTPYMLDESHRVNSAKVFGGYTYWVEDETEVHRLRGEIEELSELLKEESSLLREENELKKRKISVNVKRQLYDSISEFSTPLLTRMEKELDALSLSEKPRELANLCIQMAYRKRRSNMVLKQQENGLLSLEELYNAIYEPFSYMEYLDIFAGANGRLNGFLDGDLILALYDLFYACIDLTYRDLSAVLANFQEDTRRNEICMHLMMSPRGNLTPQDSHRLAEKIEQLEVKAEELSLSAFYDEEEGTIYTLLRLRKGESI